MRADEREVLERPIQALRPTRTSSSEAMAAGLDGSDRLVVSAKMLRAELLKADLERELEQVVLDCAACGKRVHYVGGLGVRAGHWAHAEPAQHHEPAVCGTTNRLRGTDPRASSSGC